ncbi:MAG: hypothetical protein AVDCRST_MAG80-886 [uncultured Rubrobacteraceae bacterium]|uniref:DUF3291 domain-containing protein n=1 Tax=uncultured Rubrobacteraceae bacterium TaxID=349277 RepID=A0A6J4Q5N6_9ACTN|nr:MAG: hypothetical protein AVDCRST_MAG80-886 [uncultured Rubrobacteraceae bacterium]
MPIRSPWIRYATADEGGEYLAMVSYFRLKGIGAMPKFLWNALRIGRQLGRSEGLVYYSMGARLGSLEFWSTTVWEDERALMRFIRSSPHNEIMEEMRPRVRRSEFVRWGISGSDAPPDRREAEGLLRRRLAAAGDAPAA